MSDCRITNHEPFSGACVRGGFIARRELRKKRRIGTAGRGVYTLRGLVNYSSGGFEGGKQLLSAIWKSQMKQPWLQLTKHTRKCVPRNKKKLKNIRHHYNTVGEQKRAPGRSAIAEPFCNRRPHPIVILVKFSWKRIQGKCFI